MLVLNTISVYAQHHWCSRIAQLFSLIFSIGKGSILY
nr:MAG TPA: hypothetical protein [Caudoviricetes sp.]